MRRKGFLIKGIVFLLVSGGIAWALYERKQLSADSFRALFQSSESPLWWVVALLLVVVNYGLEALKWQFCLREIHPVSLPSAFQAVLSGHALSFVTPHGVGDYLGRIFHLDEAKRPEAIGALFLCRLSQFYITLYVGTIAVVYYLYFQLEAFDTNYWIIAGIIFCLNVLLLGLIFYRHSTLTLLQRLVSRDWLKRITAPLIGYTQRDILRLFSIALLRHLVFCLQFIFLLRYMGIESHWLIFFLGVSFVFLIKSVIPTILELGVREVAAVLFFGLVEENHSLIIGASLGLWLINFVLPSLVGSVLIFKWKSFRFSFRNERR